MAGVFAIETDPKFEFQSEIDVENDQIDLDNIHSTNYVNDIKTNLPKFLHTNCRNRGDEIRGDNLYLNRYIVPDEFIKWQDFSVNFLKENNLNCDFGTEYNRIIKKIDDPIDTANAESSDPKNINFEKQTKRSFYPQTCLIRVNDDTLLPFNPIGATGLRGRGVLEKWGPNQQLIIAITRWKKNASGSLCIHTIDMKPVLEIILVKLNDKNKETSYGSKGYSLPFTKYNFGKDNMFDLANKRIRSAFLPEFDFTNFDEGLNLLINSGKRIYFGYIDDPRNTDNAWIESQVYNFHDQEGIFDQISLKKDIKPEECFEWEILDYNNEYCLGTFELMRRVAKFHRAHF